MSVLAIVLFVLIILALLGGVRDWGYGSGFGYGPVVPGGIGLILLILIVLVIFGRI